MLKSYYSTTTLNPLSPFFFFPFPPILFVSFVITCTTFLPFPSFSFIIPLSNAASLMSTLQCLYHFSLYIDHLIPLAAFLFLYAAKFRPG